MGRETSLVPVICYADTFTSTYREHLEALLREQAAVG